MRMNTGQVAAFYGVDRRTVTNWLNEKPPLPMVKEGRERVGESTEIDEWHKARHLRQARETWEKESRDALDNQVKAARDRRTIHEARLVELQLEEAEGKVIPLDVHEQRVRALCEPLAARCKSLTKYAGDVQLAGTDIEAAALLDRIGDELLRALMDTDVEDLEDDGGDEPETGAAA